MGAYLLRLTLNIKKTRDPENADTTFVHSRTEPTIDIGKALPSKGIIILIS